MLLAGQFGGELGAVAIAGERLYAGIGPRLALIDVSDPAQPWLAGQSGVLPGLVEKLAVDGDTVAVAAGSSSLWLFHASHPGQAEAVGLYQSLPYGAVHGVALDGELAFVVGSAMNLQALDISRPSRPALLGRSAYSPLEPRRIALMDQAAYMSDWVEGLVVGDVSNPSLPTATSAWDLFSSIQDVAAAGNIVYVADWDAGIWLFDAGDPLQPVLVGHHNTPGLALGIDVDGALAYVAGDAAGLYLLRYLALGERLFLPHVRG